MSWDPYLQTLANTEAMYYGIYSKEGAVCGQSKDFNVTFEEIVKIVKFIEKKEGDSFTVNSVPCLMVNCDEDHMKLKTKTAPHDGNKILFHCEVTKTMLIIVGMAGAGERDASSYASRSVSQFKQIGY